MDKKYPKIMVSVLAMALSMSSFAMMQYETLAETEEFNLKASITYLRETIETQLQADHINEDIFGVILKRHANVAKHFPYAADLPSRKKADFYEEATCACVTPDFCVYAPQGSFGGRFARTCCDGAQDEDINCCTCISYVPCCFMQLLFGCLLPCGYTNHCCVEEVEPAKYNTEEMKKALEALKSLYADKEWDNKIAAAKLK